MKVLILEDYFPLQRDLVEVIEQHGHEAFGVSNATEATKLLETTEIDAVITDIFVKKGDEFVPDGGILLISRVRTNIKGQLKIAKNAPILAITAASDHYNNLAPLNATTKFGADECLSKPLDMRDILSWIDNQSVFLGS